MYQSVSRNCLHLRLRKYFHCPFIFLSSIIVLLPVFPSSHFCIFTRYLCLYSYLSILFFHLYSASLSCLVFFFFLLLIDFIFPCFYLSFFFLFITTYNRSILFILLLWVFFLLSGVFSFHFSLSLSLIHFSNNFLCRSLFP